MLGPHIRDLQRAFREWVGARVSTHGSPHADSSNCNRLLRWIERVVMKKSTQTSSPPLMGNGIRGPHSIPSCCFA